MSNAQTLLQAKDFEPLREEKPIEIANIGLDYRYQDITFMITKNKLRTK